MNNQNFKKFNELVKGAEERHNALLDEELDQVNAATGTGTGIVVHIFDRKTTLLKTLACDIDG